MSFDVDEEEFRAAFRERPLNEAIDWAWSALAEAYVDRDVRIALFREVEAAALDLRQWGVVQDDPRVGYLTVQVARPSVEAVDAALAAVEKWRNP